MTGAAREVAARAAVRSSFLAIVGARQRKKSVFGRCWY